MLQSVALTTRSVLPSLSTSMSRIDALVARIAPLSSVTTGVVYGSNVSPLAPQTR